MFCMSRGRTAPPLSAEGYLTQMQVPFLLTLDDIRRTPFSITLARYLVNDSLSAEETFLSSQMCIICCYQSSIAGFLIYRSFNAV